MGISDRFKEFKETIEKNVVDTQKEIVHDVMDELFKRSPHFMDSKGDQAMGEYDASHHVSIGRSYGWAISDLQPPTYSYSLSKAANSRNASKVDSIKTVGQVVNIKNTSGHALAVETGIGWQKTSGYHTYGHTVNRIAAMHKDKLKVS